MARHVKYVCLRLRVCVFVCAWVRRPWVPRWHIIYEIEQLKGEYEVEHVHVRAR